MRSVTHFEFGSANPPSIKAETSKREKRSFIVMSGDNSWGMFGEGTPATIQQVGMEQSARVHESQIIILFKYVAILRQSQVLLIDLHHHQIRFNEANKPSYILDREVYTDVSNDLAYKLVAKLVKRRVKALKLFICAATQVQTM